MLRYYVYTFCNLFDRRPLWITICAKYRKKKNGYQFLLFIIIIKSIFFILSSGKTELSSQKRNSIVLKIFSLKNVRAPEVQLLLFYKESNLSPLAMLGYYICLSPAWEGNWGVPLQSGMWPTPQKPSAPHVEPCLTQETYERIVTSGLTAWRDTLWRPMSGLNNIKSLDDCYHLYDFFVRSFPYRTFGGCIGSFSLPEVTHLFFLILLSIKLTNFLIALDLPYSFHPPTCYRP